MNEHCVAIDCREPTLHRIRALGAEITRDYNSVLPLMLVTAG